MKLVALLLISLITMANALADKALLVSEEQYLYIEPKLQGCSADAEAMKGALVNTFGFKDGDVEHLKEPKKAEIMAALAKVAADIHSDERFVFYYSGHGMRNPPSILPLDAQKSKSDNDITMTELNAALELIQKKSNSVTAILDACYSGGMLPKGYDPIHDMEPTSKSFQRDEAKGPVDPSDAAEIMDFIQNDTNVCYVLATQYNEEALIITINGARRSIFTYYLASELSKSAVVGKQWDYVRRNVAADIQKLIPIPQHPMVAPSAFEYKKVLTDEAGGDPVPINTLQALFNSSKVSKDDYSLSVVPNNARVCVGEVSHITGTAATNGFVVAIGERPDGTFYQAYPGYETSVNAGKVFKDRLKDFGMFTCDRPGTDKINTFWFPDMTTAQSILQAFNKHRLGSGLRVDDLAQLELTPGSFYTQGMALSVSGDIIGDAQIADHKAKQLLGYLQNPTPTDKVSTKLHGWLITSFKLPEEARLLQEVYPFPYEAAYLCNRIISANTIALDPNDLSAKPSSEVQTLYQELEPKVKALQAGQDLDPDTRAKLNRLNRLLLEAAYPDCIIKAGGD